MRTMFAIAAGGALGAVARFLVSSLMQQQAWWGPFPAGTFAVNAAGAFLLGALLGALPGRAADSLWIAGLGVGFLGAFTTFSTFAWEFVTLVRDGLVRLGIAYIAVSVLAGAVAVSAGMWVGERLAPAVALTPAEHDGSPDNA